MDLLSRDPSIQPGPGLRDWLDAIVALARIRGTVMLTDSEALLAHRWAGYLQGRDCIAGPAKIIVSYRGPAPPPVATEARQCTCPGCEYQGFGHFSVLG